MSDHSHLPGKNRARADFRGTAESHLRTQQRIFANVRAVAHLHQIIDFSAASNARFADAGAVDASVRLDFHIVSDQHRGWLRNLVPAALSSLSETKSIGAHHDAVLQQDPIAETAVLPHHGVRVREKVIANFYSAINDRVRQQHRVLADHDVFLDHHIGTNMSMRSYLRSRMHHGRRVHARRIAQRLMEQFESAGKAEIRILRAQHGRRDSREVLGDDYRGGFGRTCRGRVFGIRDETEFSRASLVDSVEPGDFRFRRPVVEARVECSSDGRKFHGVIVLS